MRRLKDVRNKEISELIKSRFAANDWAQVAKQPRLIDQILKQLKPQDLPLELRNRFRGRERARA